MEIFTNNQPRSIMSFFDLNEKRQKEALENSDEAENESYFVYKRRLYTLGEFVKYDSTEWHGYSPDSYFSGVLVKLSCDGESVTVGRYCA